MALIVRKLKHKGSYKPVTMNEADSDRFTDVESFSVDGERFTVAKYRPYSRPVDKHRLTNVEVYNGGISDAPVKVFTNRGGDVKVDRKRLARDLYREWGPGQYSVFKFGGNPPKESYFENRFIAKKGEESGLDG